MASVETWLRRKSVPSSMIMMMMQQSSKEIYWLSAGDLRTLGDYAPWAEELLIARCGFVKGLETKAMWEKDETKAQVLWERQKGFAECYKQYRREQRLKWLETN